MQAQIAHNMLSSGDWVTARLDGVKYLEKSPLWYWLIAICFKIFGVHDWAARIPVVLSAMLLCWVTYRFGRWAFSKEAGTYSGIVAASCVGIFLFTRILIPDVCLTAFIALSLWAFMRAIDPEPTCSRAWFCDQRNGTATVRERSFGFFKIPWAYTFFAGIAIGMLLKGLIAALFPVGIACTYLIVTGQWRNRTVWGRLHIWTGTLIAIAIAAPWHILATLRNPPYFVATLHSGPGEYKGFFWFYFVNEHLL
ncbi:MAG: glycosyltransferase family 39 protein, partial [Acidobacteriota bacterium]|nr:glycosyltransferase family 39 protein [Acidobacteriota bacterium]